MLAAFFISSLFFIYPWRAPQRLRYIAEVLYITMRRLFVFFEFLY